MPEITTHTKSDYHKLMDSIYDGSIQLSYSSILNFAKSPRHFVNYKLRKVEPTAAMQFGSLFHCLVLEADEVNARYGVCEKAPNTLEAQKFCSAIISGKSLDESFASSGWSMNNYKTEKAKKKVGEYSEYIDLSMSATWTMNDDDNGIENYESPKIIVSKDVMDSAEHYRDAIYNNRTARTILDQITETEISKRWKYGGFNWRGYIDGQGEGIKLDLKSAADALPRKFKRKSFDMRYDWQAALYNLGSDDDYMIIAIDKGFNISCHEITRRTQQNALQEINECIRKFNYCAAFNLWNMSYDFHNEINEI